MPKKDKPLRIASDTQLAGLLITRNEADKEKLWETLDDLKSVIQEAETNNEAPIFAYGKLINYLSEGVSRRDLASVCASALWEINKNGWMNSE